MISTKAIISSLLNFTHFLLEGKETLGLLLKSRFEHSVSYTCNEVFIGKIQQIFQVVTTANSAKKLPTISVYSFFKK
jgi:hypothetical protein